MFGRRQRGPRPRVLLLAGDTSNVKAAREALKSEFELEVATHARAAGDKLHSRSYDCLLLDPDVLDGSDIGIAEVLALAGPEAAIVVLCRPHREEAPATKSELSGVILMDSEILRVEGLADRIRECIQIAQAARAGEIDAFMLPGVGTATPLLAAGSEGPYRQLVETLQEGILTIDSRGDILFSNRRVGDILDCDADTLLGENIASLVDDRNRQAIMDSIERTLAGTNTRSELGLAIPGQRRAHVMISFGLIGDTGAGERGVCLVMTDLTEEKRLRDSLETLAITDPLTRLPNRWYLNEWLDRECRRARRYERPLSCLMMDLDDFKQCNDRYGHLAGDAVLRQAAAIIKQAVRETDVVARYGGEEFCLILPETGREGAELTAQRIRMAIGEHAFDIGGRSISVTVSIGLCAPSQKEDLDPETIVGCADSALAAAKAAGKNRVCAHAERPADRPELRERAP